MGVADRRQPDAIGRWHDIARSRDHSLLDALLAENVVFLKRSMRPGFAGIDNDLLFDQKTTLLFGDAKDTLTKLVAAVKEA